MQYNINDRLREILNSTGLKLATWAQKLGVSQALLYNYLQKDRTPSLEFIQKVIILHPEISIPWLVTGEGEMNTPDKDSNPEKSMEELIKKLQDKILSLEEVVKAKDETISSQKKAIEALESALSLYKDTDS